MRCTPSPPDKPPSKPPRPRPSPGAARGWTRGGWLWRSRGPPARSRTRRRPPQKGRRQEHPVRPALGPRWTKVSNSQAIGHQRPSCQAIQAPPRPGATWRRNLGGLATAQPSARRTTRPAHSWPGALWKAPRRRPWPVRRRQQRQRPRRRCSAGTSTIPRIPSARSQFSGLQTRAAGTTPRRRNGSRTCARSPAWTWTRPPWATSSGCIIAPPRGGRPAGRRPARAASRLATLATAAPGHRRSGRAAIWATSAGQSRVCPRRSPWSTTAWRGPP
mmetsp:Transcript_89875/g.275150  ORF Transcript_89875/g.275150 Transcript_89875/m.275150 type:complete len:274 (+) Transcript_89875:367-1188(+)